jgi:electron transport complex protein RnfC
MDVGVLVQNVGTASAVYDAIVNGIPLIERVLTVSGKGIKEPKNLLVRIGTLFSDLIEECGGLIGDVAKVVMGGPMMGLAQYSLDVPVIKGTSGILCLTKEEIELEERSNCIRCGKCVESCPIKLLPTTIAAFSEYKRFDDAEYYNALDCIECGCCSYVCPAKIPLVHLIRSAKTEIMLKNRREKEEKK